MLHEQLDKLQSDLSRAETAEQVAAICFREAELLARNSYRRGLVKSLRLAVRS